MKKSVTKKLRQIAIEQNPFADDQKKLYKKLKKAWKQNMKVKK